MANAAYVTGAHNFKAGIQYNQATGTRSTTFALATRSAVRTGVPSSVLADNTPVNNEPGHDEFGAFVQDSWTLDRLTINAGLRFDWFHPWVGEQVAGRAVGPGTSLRRD